MMRSARAAVITLAAFAGASLLGACGDDTDPGTSPELTTATSTTTPPEETVVPPEEPTSPGPEDVVEQSVALLAEQLGVPPAQISSTSTEVTWRDGSLGCPQKGMGYTDALVPGVLVELEVDGTTYEFHQGGMQPPFYCANPDPDGTTEP